MPINDRLHFDRCRSWYLCGIACAPVVFGIFVHLAADRIDEKSRNGRYARTKSKITDMVHSVHTEPLEPIQFVVGCGWPTAFTAREKLCCEKMNKMR